jgi:Tfp pilus assembly protein PilF
LLVTFCVAQHSPENDGETCACLHNLALLYAESGDFEKAVALGSEALRSRRANDTERRHLTFTLFNMAVAYRDGGWPELATPYYREALQIEGMTVTHLK